MCQQHQQRRGPTTTSWDDQMKAWIVQILDRVVDLQEFGNTILMGCANLSRHRLCPTSSKCTLWWTLIMLHPVSGCICGRKVILGPVEHPHGWTKYILPRGTVLNLFFFGTDGVNWTHHDVPRHPVDSCQVTQCTSGHTKMMQHIVFCRFKPSTSDADEPRRQTQSHFVPQVGVPAHAQPNVGVVDGFVCRGYRILNQISNKSHHVC